MDERAVRALARVKAAGRLATTAVEVRCRRRGHALLSLHPVGDREFLVWRRAGRLAGADRDRDEWLRHGAGTDDEGFGPAGEDARVVAGPDSNEARHLLGRSTALACSCTGFTADHDLAERVYEALLEWYEASQRGEKPNLRRVVPAP